MRKRPPIYSGVAGILAKAVDTTVGVFAPRLVHRFQVARAKSAALLAFEAARISRTNPREPTLSADADILPDLQKLRDLSRALIRDDAHAASSVDILEENIVGAGLTAQPACTPKATGLSPEACEEWNEACREAFATWAEEEADAAKHGTFAELQALVLRTFVTDGEAFAHTVFGGDGTIAIEIIDSDRIESPGQFDTRTIRGGVEIDKHGAAVRYHVLKDHPNDTFFGGGGAARESVALPREDNGYAIMLHVFRKRRAGQTRGVPWVTPALGFAKHLHHYLDSEVIAARVAACYAMFIKKPISEIDQDVFPVVDNEQATGQSFLQELQPGQIEYLAEGEEPVPYTPNRPGTQFTAFVERILRAQCATMGLAYELVAKDFARMNLSSARAVLRECRRGFDLSRARLVRQFCRPTYQNVIRAKVQAGILTPPAGWLDNPRAFLACKWVAPAYGIVDPVTDTKGSVEAVAANVSTPQLEAAAQGLDAEQVLRDRAAFLAKARDIEVEFGLEPGVLTRAPNQPSQPSGAASPKGNNNDDASGASDGGRDAASDDTETETAEDTAEANA